MTAIPLNPENLSLKERERLAFMAGNHERADELGRQIDSDSGYHMGYDDGRQKGYEEGEQDGAEYMQESFISAMRKVGISEELIDKVRDEL